MRVQHPKVGDTRTRSGFLFWPMRIGTESRWLEFAEWEEVWGWGDTVRNMLKPPVISGADQPARQPEPIRLYGPEWKTLRWLNEKELV